MSLEQYNFLMGSMLNQWHALAKLRAEIEGKEERVCWRCRKFGYLAYNCRNMKEAKGKLVSQNRFEVIASRVIQCGVRKETKVKRQKIVEERVQYFRCQRIGHYKWECPNIKMEKKRKGAAGREAGTSQLGKGTKILWSGEYTRRCTAVGVRMDDRRSHSNLHRIQIV